MGEVGLEGVAGRVEILIMFAGTQIHVGMIEPVALRQSLQWSVVTKGRGVGLSAGEYGWRGREETWGAEIL